MVVGVRRFYVQQYCNEIKCNSNNNTLFFLPVYPSKETTTPFSSYLVAQLVRQRNAQGNSTNVESTERLPKAIFRFLNQSEINITLREEVPKLYTIMYSSPSLPYIVSVTHLARLGELEPMYRIKTMTTRHQCTTWSVVRTLRNWGVPNDYLNPSTSSMKMIVWNCEGNGNVAFQNHAYELHRRHRPQILIIVKIPIAEERAQLLTPFCTLILGEQIRLVLLEVYGCFGMRATPSRWTFSLIVRMSYIL